MLKFIVHATLEFVMKAVNFAGVHFFYAAERGVHKLGLFVNQLTCENKGVYPKVGFQDSVKFWQAHLKGKLVRLTVNEAGVDHWDIRRWHGGYYDDDCIVLAVIDDISDEGTFAVRTFPDADVEDLEITQDMQPYKRSISYEMIDSLEILDPEKVVSVEKPEAEEEESEEAPAKKVWDGVVTSHKKAEPSAN